MSRHTLARIAAAVYIGYGILSFFAWTSVTAGTWVAMGIIWYELALLHRATPPNTPTAKGEA